MRNLYKDLFRKTQGKIAIIYNEEEYSYQKFFQCIDEFAGFLLFKEIHKGNRVAIVGFNRLEILIAAYACFKLGVVVVPLSSKDQIQVAIDSAQCCLILEEFPHFDTVDKSKLKEFNEAMIIFTSGTTSEGRKGVILGHDSIGGTVDFMNRKMDIDGSVVECVFAPVDHAFAFGRCHAVLMVGGTVCLGDEIFSYSSLFRVLEKYKCNSLSIMPAILASLMKIAAPKFVAVGKNLRWIQTGAMRFDKNFRELICTSLPCCNIFFHYGLSEAMRATFLNLSKNLNKRNTEGLPADGVEIGIFNDNGDLLGADCEGTIAIRGRNLALGYTDRILWKKVFRDGWFFSSDRGKLDADGYLIFLGRNDDIINVNGYLIHPDEIEEKLCKLFTNQTFSVVGIEDPGQLKDKVVVICVEGDNTVSISEVSEALGAVNSYMLPRYIFSVDKIPRTHTGKVMRRQLEKLIVDSMIQKNIYSK